MERELNVSQDDLWKILQEITEALRHADNIACSKTTDVTYETLQRAGFNRPTGWRRRYNLADARQEARSLAMRLRAAWEVLDPSSK